MLPVNLQSDIFIAANFLDKMEIGKSYGCCVLDATLIMKMNLIYKKGMQN
jgi:hypothetical protein